METVLRSKERIAAIVGSLENIATLPEVIARITAAVHDPRSTANDLQRIMCNDPALVTRILKLANSSFYARAREISSLERAIVMLGFDAIHNLAVAATIGQMFKGKVCEGYSASDLWRHCIAVAATSRWMAQSACEEFAEDIFLAGLLHDVGVLVELQVCRGKLRQVCEAAKLSETPFSSIELEVIGVDHQELGMALAEKWGFPRCCRVVAGYHHHPALADEEWQLATALVNASDALCAQASFGFDLTARTQMPDAPGFAGMIPLRLIDEAREKLPDIVEPALQVFG